MPNHCYQTVYIHGPREMVQELYWGLELQRPRFNDIIVPIPFDKLSGMTGHQWRCDNWGTKWEVQDVEIDDDGLEHSEAGVDVHKDAPNVSWFSFRCWTAWTPPVPVWDKLHELGITVDADYEDECGMFEGTYQSGVDSSWIPDEIHDGDDHREEN